MKVNELGGDPIPPLVAPREGAIRHYMISRIFLGRLIMNDKGNYRWAYEH